MSSRRDPMTSRTRLVPGHPAWRAYRRRCNGRTVAVRIRHRLLFWRVFDVPAGSLRAGAERAARMLEHQSR